MNLFVSSCLPFFRDLSIVGIVGQAIVTSLAFIPPPERYSVWWGHSAVLGNGEMRPIWCYRDNPQTRQAIDEWADSLAEI